MAAVKAFVSCSDLLYIYFFLSPLFLHYGNGFSHLFSAGTLQHQVRHGETHQ